MTVVRIPYQSEIDAAYGFTVKTQSSIGVRSEPWGMPDRVIQVVGGEGTEERIPDFMSKVLDAPKCFHVYLDSSASDRIGMLNIYNTDGVCYSNDTKSLFMPRDVGLGEAVESVMISRA